MRNCRSVDRHSFEAAGLQHMPCQDSRLNEAQLEFLNSDACQVVSPYSRTFWPDLKTWLSHISSQAAAYPKAYDYRHMLEPYLHQQVHMLAKAWTIKDITEDGRIRLLLKDLRLTNVRGSHVGRAPNAVVDHMNIWVSASWLNHVVPSHSEPLALDGVLHEYTSSRQIRNIGILPVLVMPGSRSVNGAGTSLTGYARCAAPADTAA